MPRATQGDRESGDVQSTPGSHGAGLAVRIIAPFAAAYFLSLFFRSINALIAPDLVAELTLGPSDIRQLTTMFLLTLAI